jgi:hypothetical protein
MNRDSVGPIAGRYNKLSADRQPYLDRAREMARLTVPSLYPPDGFSTTSKLTVPYQNLGARGVNNIANKLHLTLLPPNSPFFRYQPDTKAKQNAVQDAGGDGKKVLTEIEKALGEIEKAVQAEIEAARFRPHMFEALRQMVVGGNSLLYLPKDRPARVFNLANYVVERDGGDKIQEIIVHEKVGRGTLPDYALSQLNDDSDKKDEDVDVYTRVYRQHGTEKYLVKQELKGGIEIKEAAGSYPSEQALPWFALRLTRVEGESYGRSYVEEYQGDLQSLEGLTKALVEGSAIMAKVVFLLKPNGTLKPRTLAEAENGAVLSGDRLDVETLQVEKRADFSIVLQTIERINQRLEFAFLLNTAVQRNAERVTAEEIRYMAQELEGALGGVYSLLSQEFQLKLVKLFGDRMSAKGAIPKLTEQQARPVIITGIEALGRGNDLNKLRAFVEDLVKMATADPSLVQRIRKEDLVKRLAMGHGLNDADTLIIDDEEFQAMQQQAQQQAMMQELATKALPGMAQTATERMMPEQTETQ